MFTLMGSFLVSFCFPWQFDLLGDAGLSKSDFCIPFHPLKPFSYGHQGAHTDAT